MTDWKFIVEKWLLHGHRPEQVEPEVRKTMRSFSGKLFVDIGANWGLYTRLLSPRFDIVYAFEPNPNYAAALRSRIPSNVRVFETALSNQEGTTTLYVDPLVEARGGTTDTILPAFDYKVNPPRKGWNSGTPNLYVGKTGFQVKTTTYDRGVREIADLVKIDVEGAEFLVLEGMKNSIDSRRVRNILVELHNIDRKTELETILKIYKLRWVDPDHLLGMT